jgi:hypothetical protein
MRCARWIALFAGVFGAVLVPAPSALAGGSVFRFDQRYYVPGDVATGQVTYSLNGTGSGRWRDRPYYAYLVPGGRWIRPPHFPADAVVAWRGACAGWSGSILAISERRRLG